MTDHHSVVEQAYEIHILVKELENFGCTVGEISNLWWSTSLLSCHRFWIYFNTSLKHNRQEFGIADLILTF
jgi:hypothetical protein